MRIIAEKDLSQLRAEEQDKDIEKQRLNYIENYLAIKDKMTFKPPKKAAK